MATKTVKEDTGIFVRKYTFLKEEATLEEIEKFVTESNEQVKKHYDIDLRLSGLEKYAIAVLAEEGYPGTSEELSGPAGIKLRQGMNSRAFKACEVLANIADIHEILQKSEANAARIIAPVCIDLGRNALTLSLKDSVEPKFKIHKDAPFAGGAARSKKYESIKAAIFHENSKIDKNLSRRERARIIDKNLKEKMPDEYETEELNEDKIYGHLRRIAHPK